MLSLQIWGGLFYLLNKVFFSLSERTTDSAKRHLRILSWAVYLIGLPAVVAMLMLKHDWIFAAIEIGGAPSMTLGLVIALRGKGCEPKWLNYFALVAITLGLVYSLYAFGGMTTYIQWLEVGAALGFLVGTYRLAREHADGYFWYMLMNTSAGLLLWLQELHLFALQQGASLLFVIDAYYSWKRKHTFATT